MSSMPKSYLVKLKKHFSVAERTMAFQFEKPENFTFIPGQWIDLTLVSPSETDAEGNVRGFSIASSPEENHIMVATRMRDTAFKRELMKLRIDQEVEITPAGGGLTLHNNTARTAVFLAGGIGVTPIRSMLIHASIKKLPHRILFFFSNRRPEDAPFLDELKALKKDNPNYSLIPTMTNLTHSLRHWVGETGKVDKAMLARHMEGAKSPIYYICGPQEMVNGLQGMLNGTGVDNDDIRIEGFSGY